MTNHPYKERSRVTWPIFNFHARNHISRTAKASRQILYTDWIYQMLALGWQTTLQMGLVSVTCPIFYILAPNDIFGIGEARHFKFRVLFDTEEY